MQLENIHNIKANEGNETTWTLEVVKRKTFSFCTELMKNKIRYPGSELHAMKVAYGESIHVWSDSFKEPERTKNLNTILRILNEQTKDGVKIFGPEFSKPTAPSDDDSELLGEYFLEDIPDGYKT